jgi:chromosome segregation ATPase
MSEEQTERFEGGTPFEIRVLRELANLNNRLTSLEAKVDARLHDTRPIWESVLSRLDSMKTRLDSIETRLEKMDAKLDVLTRDSMDTRADVELLKKRPPAA